MSDTPPDQLSYAQAVEELNGIIAELDEGLVDVDALTARFQRAIDIMEDLDGRIRRARAKVDELAPRLEAISKAASESMPAATSAPPGPPAAAPPAPAYDYGDEPF
jgi:exodeoxyribonuclease VII small subunit